MKLEKWKNKWKEWSNLRKWQIWKLKLIDARLYFVSIFVGLLTGLVAVPYHYLLWYFFDVRKTFFTAHYPWYWHVLLFFILWGILIFVASLVKRMPLIAGGGIPQTRAANNGRIRYEHPFKELVAKFCGGVLALSAGLSLGREGPSVQIGSYVGCLVSRWTHILKGERKQLLAAGAGAGLAAAFAAPLASSLIVIESIERFDAPKNGITTSLRSLMKNIDLDKRNYYISFCQGKAKRHGEQLATFSDKVNFFAVAEYFNLTAANKTVNKLYKEHLVSTNQYIKSLGKRIEQNFLRSYGNAKFDRVIQFCGYEDEMILLYSPFKGQN